LILLCHNLQQRDGDLDPPHLDLAKIKPQRTKTPTRSSSPCRGARRPHRRHREVIARSAPCACSTRWSGGRASTRCSGSRTVAFAAARCSPAPLKFPVPSQKFPAMPKKFPVPLRRESSCIHLNLLSDWERESQKRAQNQKNSLLISLECTPMVRHEIRNRLHMAAALF
jgi:hypothetical protein